MKLAILSILLVAVASASCQTIDVWDFVNGNVVTPLVTDLATGTLSVFNNLLASLLGSLGNLISGKRDLLSFASQYQNLVQGLTSQFSGDLTTLFNGVVSQLSGIFSNWQNFVGAKRMSTKMAVERIFVDAEVAARDIISDLLDQFLQRLGNIGTNLVNVSLATVLGAISGKRALSDLFATLTGTVSGLLGNLSDAASTLTQQLVDAVSPHIQDLQTTLVNTSLDAAQSLLNTLANISQSIGRK